MQNLVLDHYTFPSTNKRHGSWSNCHLENNDKMTSSKIVLGGHHSFYQNPPVTSYFCSNAPLFIRDRAFEKYIDNKD